MLGVIITCTWGAGAVSTCTGGVGCYNYLHRGSLWDVGCYNYLHRGSLGGVGCYNYRHRGCEVLSLPAQGVWGAIITYTGGVGCYHYLHGGSVGGVGCHNYLHRRSLGGAGCGVTTKCLSGLESLVVLDVLHASLVRLGVVGVLVGQVVQGVVDGAGVPHLLHGPLIGVTALQVHQHTEVQRVETAAKNRSQGK